MTRMFYDCPIKAAYMQKYFGVKLECLVPDWKGDNEWKSFNKVDLEDPNLQPGLDVGEALKALEKVKKIYVHSESEHLFKPKDGDVLGWTNGTFRNTFHTYSHHCCIKNRESHAIITRDNKRLFIPEMEE